MAGKNTNLNLTIRINGKQVKNTLTGVKKEMNSLKKEVGKATRGTEEYEKKSKELRKVKKIWKEMNEEINGTNSLLSKVKKHIGPVVKLVTAAFTVERVISFVKGVADSVKELTKVKKVVKQLTGLQGEQLDRTAARVKALSDSFDQDTKKMTEAANNLSKQMKIDFDEALDLIEQGFLDGADANGDFLDKVREYPALLNEAGLSADEAISLMTQEIKQGIYSDKGVDAIKEANLRLREMPKSAQEALDAIGLSSKNIQKELQEGSKTTFDVIQQVSKRMATLPPQSKLVGQAIADIFGGPGEDAGLRYLSNLHKIDLSLNSITASSQETTKAKQLEIKANESLNNVWVKLTGTGSTLATIYNSFKLGLADLLGWLTGVKDEALEAKNAFEDQAKNVVGLQKNLVPLLDEYDRLKAKTKLSKEEQERLEIVIGKIGDIVPTAITAFNEYGKAMDISSDKAREFIETQKALLKYRNAELIEEETEKLSDLNEELRKINSTLNNRNEDGDIVKTVHQFTKTDRLIISEEKLSGAKIKSLQKRAKEIKQLQLGVQASLDEHTGDYLDKFINAEKKKTEKTAEEIAARKLLEETAAKLRLKDFENLSDAELRVLIAKQIEKNNELAGINKKNSEKEAKEREQRLLKEQAYQDQVLLGAKSLLEQEHEAHMKRLEQAGLFDEKKLKQGKRVLKESIKTNKKQQQVLEVLEAQHQAKIAKIELNATNKHLAEKKKKYESEKNARTIAFNNELSEIKTLDEAKKKLSQTLSDHELEKINTFEEAKKALRRQHEAEELQKQAEYLQSIINLYTTALSTGEIEGVSFADKILTPEQKEILNEQLEQVRLKLSEVNAEKNNLSGNSENEDFTELSDVDIFGSSPEQWANAFSNLETAKEKLAGVATVLQGLQQAWGLYNQFLANNDKKRLRELEKHNQREKDELQRRLDEGLISQDEYNDAVERLDNELAKKQAEIEYKQAKRERTAALFGIASNTALGIMKAVASFPLTGGMPWAGIIAAMGALQAGLVLSAPLPDRGYKDGGYTKSLGYKDHTGEDVAGVVHDGEYVVPKFVMNSTDPAIPVVLKYLEHKRKEKLGYFNTGGSTSTTPPEFEEENETTTLNDNSSNNELLVAVQTLNGILENGIEAFWVENYEDFIARKEKLKEFEEIYKNTRQ
jgi:hypothetical protein